jgi:tRNA (cytidine/uridine-2'-O-)-methyltransferase
MERPLATKLQSAGDGPLLHVVLYQPEIPPNTGNIGRSCVAVGAKLWLVRPLGFQTGEKELRRAGLDYWSHLDWEAVENWQELTERLAGPIAAGRMWLLTKTASRLYTEAAYQRGDVLLFGNESSGLPEELRQQYAGQTLRIPMRDEVRSLNLSVAAGIVMYEAVRQIEPGIG